ncbi:hypothetical protein D3C76_1842700 [compost metagenome]
MPTERSPDGTLKRIGFCVRKLARRHDISTECLKEFELRTILEAYVKDRATR